MSSPWGKVTNPEPLKLQDIMSEEVAKDLQAKENKKYVQSLCHDGNCESESVVNPEVLQVIAEVEGEEDSDAVIARMLQRQFDEEYDKMLEIKEQKCNGDSKVSISFTNYRRVPQILGKFSLPFVLYRSTVKPNSWGLICRYVPWLLDIHSLDCLPVCT